MDITSIIVAGVSLIGTMVGSYMANRKTTAVMAYQIEDLKRHVEKHNSVIERTYKLESDMRTAFERIDGLRSDVIECKEHEGKG